MKVKHLLLIFILVTSTLWSQPVGTRWDNIQGKPPIPNVGSFTGHTGELLQVNPAGTAYQLVATSALGLVGGSAATPTISVASIPREDITIREATTTVQLASITLNNIQESIIFRNGIAQQASDFIWRNPRKFDSASGTFAASDVVVVYNISSGAVGESRLSADNTWAGENIFSKGATFTKEIFVGSFTYVYATCATDQLVLPNAHRVVLFGTQVYDTLNEYDPSTSVFTSKQGGLYAVDVRVLGIPGTSLDWELLVNSTMRDYNSLAGFAWVKLSGCFFLNAGDTITIKVYSNSGVSSIINEVGGERCHLIIYRVIGK